MKNKSIITISNGNGTKAFHLSRWQTFILKLMGLLIFLVIFSAIFNFSYLSDKFEQVKTQETKLLDKSSTLQSNIQNLNLDKLALQRTINEKNQLINNVTARLDNLERSLNSELQNNEDILLVNNDTDDLSEKLSNRLDIATVKSAIQIELLRSLPNGSPVKNARLSSKFGYRIHPITKQKRKHYGLDFAVNTGTPVYATADGVVKSIRKSNIGSGNLLVLQHDLGFTSSFMHLKSFQVKAGDIVEKGQLIATSGNTGASSGPHLHYEVRFVGKALDPLAFVEWKKDNFDAIFEKEKAVKWDYLVNKMEQRVVAQLKLLSQINAELLVKSK